MIEAKTLGELHAFKGLGDTELQSLADIMTERSYKAGSVIFTEDELGDSMFLITTGRVEISKRITPQIHKTLARLGQNEVFGEMSLVDPGYRSAKAKATQDSTLLTLERRDFLDLATSDHAMGLKVFLNLALTLTKRLREANDRHLQAMRWGYHIAGATRLNFYHLMQERAFVEVDLVTGSSVAGYILKVEDTQGGHELTVQDEKDRVHILPYHSVAAVHLGEISLTLDLGPEQEAPGS